ncbi:MAG: protein-glutamate O-methyltransferase CheR [Clostridia bacterium]|nr:protein-glutamate O-methyltransferase CheR [Clostridia bacterium]
MIKLTQSEFMMIASYVRKKYGINLEKKQFLIESKLWIELARCKCDTYSEYWQMLQNDKTGTLEQRMVDRLTTNYTYFCREEAHFSYVTDQVIPKLQRSWTENINIWCGACATGQECYTLAMYLMDCQKNGTLTVPFHILGTDISADALKTAQKARYDSKDYARLLLSWRSQYCGPFENGTFEVKPLVKKNIDFQKHNLLNPMVMGEQFHIVFCRNVLIYFKEEERNQLLKNIYREMLPGGYLFISHTETLQGTQLPFEYIQPAVYRKPEGRKNG